MLKRLMATDDDVTAFVLRIFLGLVFFPHGAQKVFGWFGGMGFSGTMEAFTVKAGIPAVLAFLAIMSESAGVLALFAGLFTRVAALGIAVNMIVCALANHLQHGFFMNWFGAQKGEGVEFHLLAVGIAAALLIKGGGLWSLDRALTRKP